MSAYTEEGIAEEPQPPAGEKKEIAKLEPVLPSAVEDSTKADQNAKQQQQRKQSELEEKEKSAKDSDSPAAKKKELSRKARKSADYYKYKLVGVVVHNGNADSGHYYSYINVARHEWESSDKYLHPEQDRWVEFNDSLIREFSFQRLETECFGGGQEDNYAVGDAADATGEFAGLLAGRSKSAYMLIYEKREKMPIPEKDPTYVPAENDLVLGSLECDSTAVSRAESSHQRVVYKDEKDGACYRLHRFHNVPFRLAEDIKSEVNRDNVQYMFERLAFDKAFIKFACDTFSSARICSDYVSDPVLKKSLRDAICDVSEKLLFGLVPRANVKDMYALGSLGETMAKIYAANPDRSARLIRGLCADAEKLPNLLVRCPEQKVRMFVGKGVLAAFISVFAGEEKTGFGDPEAVTRKLMDKLLDMINYDLMSNWTKFGEFFELLKSLVYEGGETLLKYSFDKDLPAKLLDFFLEKQSPAKLQSRRMEMGNSVQSPEFGGLMELVTFLVRHTQSVGAGEARPAAPPTKLPGGDLVLSSAAVQCLQAEGLVPKFVRTGGKLEQVGKLLVHLCYGSRKFSKKTCKLLLQSLGSYEAGVLAQCVEVVRDLLSLEDEFQELRIEWLLGYCQPVDRTQYGLAGVFDGGDDVNCYVSPIGVATRDDPLLQLVWRSRNRVEQFTLQALKAILQVSEKSEQLYGFLKRIPPPNYLCAHYFDWVPGFLDQLAKSDSVVSFYNKTEKDALIAEVRGLVEVFGRRVLSEDQTPSYIIGKTTNTEELKERERVENGVKLVLTQLETEVYPERRILLEKSYLISYLPSCLHTWIATSTTTQQEASPLDPLVFLLRHRRQRRRRRKALRASCRPQPPLKPKRRARSWIQKSQARSRS